MEKQENNVTSASTPSGSSPRTVVMRPSPPIKSRRSSSAKKTVTDSNVASNDNKSDHSPNGKDKSKSKGSSRSRSNSRSERSNDKDKSSEKSPDSPLERSESPITFHSDHSTSSPVSEKSEKNSTDNDSDGHSDNHSEGMDHEDVDGTDHDNVHADAHTHMTPNDDMAFPPTPSEDAVMDNPPYGSISDVSSHDVEKMIEKNNKYTPYMRRCMVYIDRAGKVIDEQKELCAALDKFEAMRDNSELCTEEDLRSFISDTQVMRAENELKLNVEKLVSLAQSNRDRYNECNDFCKSLEQDDIESCLRDLDKYIKLFMRADEILKGHDDNSMSM